MDAEDDIVETITVFLYLNLSEEVFGRRFTRALGKRLCRYLKFTTPTEALSRLGRIRRKVHNYRSAAESVNPKPTPELAFQNHISSVVQTMLSEAGAEGSATDESNETFSRFDAAVRRIKGHLSGIRTQHGYLMG